MLTNPGTAPNQGSAGGDTQPLADRVRPRTIEDFIGQAHLREKIDAVMNADRLPSMLLYGPPGCGKSTLALLLARHSGLPYIRVSAPEAGISSLRKRLQGMQLLILDELHRFSKAQQDFFLPILENGEMTLIATTTENPSFSITRQLLSRLHVLRLEAHTRHDLMDVARRGLKRLEIEVPDETLHLLTKLAQGDARSLLNLIEYLAELPEDHRDPEHLKGLLPDIVLRHDKAGDSHYDLASAMIKSIRGSDPDAAVYYLACLLEGGEDPRFVCRRLILSAGEDIGLADPNALQMAVACQQAVEFVGMPEGFIPMSECAVYLALAKKSNSTYEAYHRAAAEVRKNGAKPVPLHIRNAATQQMKEWGYGKGYKYPHNFPGAWVAQEYLPDELQGRSFYHSKDQGEEPKLSAPWKAHLRKK